jgi:Ca-activated chloride channel family protein
MIDWEAFHFIRPEWLWAIPLALLLAFLLTKISAKRSGWQSVVSHHLYQRLVISNDKKATRPPFYLLALAMTIASVAIAGPTWKQLPQPVYQVETGKVILLDMSMSMRATDLQPDRLSRAKFKTIDLLNSFEDGEVGLVVYAGDAFTVSPLTSDTSNITALVPSLRPEIMPLPGSEPIYAFEEAERLLAAAGYAKGEIYWITDGIDFGLVEELREFIAKSSYRYSVLGVGTRAGAPIQLEDGSLLKDARGNIVLPSLNSNLITQVIGTSDGRYTPIQSDDSDIQNMLFESTILDQNQVSNEVLGQGDQWQDMGVYLTFLILPFAAYAFRKGVLVVVLACGLTLPTDQAYAATSSSPWYENIFKNNNQKGLTAFENENYATASEQFEDPMWKGAAFYKNGDYDAALAAFKQANGAESHYNQGNALAQMGQLLEALEQYETTLTLDPDHQNAQTNKKIVEDLLKQQENEDQQQNQDGQGGDDSESGEDAEEGESADGAENAEGTEGQSSEEGDTSQSEMDAEGQPGDGSDKQSQSDDAQQAQDQENNEQRSDGSQQSQSEVPEEGEQQQNQAQAQNQQEQSSGSEAENTQESGDESGEETKQESTAEQQISAVQRVNEEDLTPEQREQAQRMQMLMNKVTDDPAYLLQRKMQLEAQKRRRERISQPNKKDW